PSHLLAYIPMCWAWWPVLTFHQLTKVFDNEKEHHQRRGGQVQANHERGIDCPGYCGSRRPVCHLSFQQRGASGQGDTAAVHALVSSLQSILLGQVTRFFSFTN